MTRENPSESGSDSETSADGGVTRRAALTGGGAVSVAFLGGDWWPFSMSSGEVNKLLDSGEAVIDLDDIRTLDIGAGLSTEKDAGKVTIDAQEVEDALLTVLDGGVETSTTVEEVNFATDLDVTDDGNGRVTVDVASDGGSGSGGLTAAASGQQTLLNNSYTETLGISPGMYIFRAYLSSGSPSSWQVYGLTTAGSPGGGDYAELNFNTTDGVYELTIEEQLGTEITVDWAVYQL